MQKLTYLFGFIMLFFVACKKENTDPAATAKNIAGVYKITGLKAKTESGSQADVYNQLNECQRNDTWDFQEDGTFLYGGVATNDCQSDDYSGTWSLNNKSFTIAAPQNTTTYHLESFNGRTLVLSVAGTINGDPAKYFVTFGKQ